MKNIIKRKNGQFVIIAALLVAVMMISLSPLLHEAATYYTHEPWDEYIALVGNIELSFNRLMEISLANYTQDQNASVLNDNLEAFQKDLTHIYPGRGVKLDYTLSEDTGIETTWNASYAYSKAKAQLSIEVSSIGLSGYRLNSEILFAVDVNAVESESDQMNIILTKENGEIVNGLEKSNFKIISESPVNITRMDHHYDETNTLVYTLTFNSTVPEDIIMEVWDQRGIKVRFASNSEGSSEPTPTPTIAPPTPPPNSETISLFPIEDGDQINLKKNGDNKNSNCVDEATSDEDITYVNTFKVSFGSDTYVIQNSSNLGTINYVKIYSTSRYSWATGGEARVVIRIAGSNYYGNVITLKDYYETNSTIFVNNPAGGSWNWDVINEMQCGIELRGIGGAECRCTQLYVEVNYTP